MTSPHSGHTPLSPLCLPGARAFYPVAISGRAGGEEPGSFQGACSSLQLGEPPAPPAAAAAAQQGWDRLCSTLGVSWLTLQLTLEKEPPGISRLISILQNLDACAPIKPV